MEIQEFQVETETNERIDKFLSVQMEELSRSYVQ